jgi:hypothetical protein
MLLNGGLMLSFKIAAILFAFVLLIMVGLVIFEAITPMLPTAPHGNSQTDAAVETTVMEIENEITQTVAAHTLTMTSESTQIPNN